ncbi:MAG: 2-deoxyribose-5-phosphate aldolase, partial [Oscillospiraceae bacterium]
MDINTILSHIDHTLLAPDATDADITRLCKEALEFHTASVCVNPVNVKLAKQILGKKIPICTVVGFPLGAATTLVKALEAKLAIADGAKEIDMV